MPSYQDLIYKLTMRNQCDYRKKTFLGKRVIIIIIRKFLKVQTINIIYYYSYCKLIEKYHLTQPNILPKFSFYTSFFLSHQHFALDYIMSIINH